MYLRGIFFRIIVCGASAKPLPKHIFIMDNFTSVQLRKRKKDGELSYYDLNIYYANTAVSVDEIKEFKIKIARVEKKYVNETTMIVSKKMPEYDNVFNELSEIRNKLEGVINDYYKEYKKKPSCEYVKEYYNKPIKQAQQKLDGVVSYYREFLESKVLADSSKGFYDNIIDCFEQFEERKNKFKKIQFSDFEKEDFWKKFINFLAYEKEDRTRVKKKRYGLTNNTLMKRLKTITEFMRWAMKKKKVQLDYLNILDYITDARRKENVVTYANSKFSLTMDEVQFLVNFIPTKHNDYKELFLFLVLTGFRVSDMLDLNDKFIYTRNGRYYINKDQIKTGGEVDVELHPLAYQIWLKYKDEKGRFNFYEQDLNDALKILMKEFYLAYKPHYEALNNHEYELMVLKKERKGKEINDDKVYKWDMLSSHYGRVTFSTLLGAQAGKLSLAQLMEKTGHKDIKVALSYQKTDNMVSMSELFPITQDTEKK
jgi:hypothetical protein